MHITRASVFSPWERHQWANVFKAGMEALQLDGVGFSPASMRAGGATHVFREKENLAALQYLGRWSKASTLRHYLHDAFSMYTTMHFTDRAVELQRLVHQHVSRLSAPPSARLTDLLSS